jgi:glycosyltransferase involved in cell wall biosynthesis
MLDSVHVAKWLWRFDSSLIQFTLFPSKKFKHVHPEIIRYCRQYPGNVIFGSKFDWQIKILGYIDFIVYELFGKLFPSSRVHALKLALRSSFDYLHAHEVQGAGYLCSQLDQFGNAEFILSIWGSDLIYFEDLPDHKERIVETLSKAQSLSAECVRDYKIAKKLGFHGVELPIIPVSASFNFEANFENLKPVVDRNLIVVKTYGLPFGRGDLAIAAVARLLDSEVKSSAFFYSVSESLLEDVKNLENEYPDRVKFTEAKNPIPQADLNRIFREARFYVGASESDGISTSFLEALAFGAYPIQTNTSCASEWENLGVTCSIVSLDQESISQALQSNYHNFDYLQHSQDNNFEIAKQYLSDVDISAKALTFYCR